MKPDPGKRERLAIVSLSPIARDARVLRQVEHARRKHTVDVFSLGDWFSPWPDVTYHGVEPRKTRRIVARRIALLLAAQLLPPLNERAYWMLPRNREILGLLQRGDYDLIHANEPPALPACVIAARSTRASVVYDAHEYILGRRGYPFLSRLVLKHYRYLLTRYLPEAKASVTTSEGYAKLYREALGVDMRVVMNAPDKVDIRPRAIDPDDIRLIHHGFATPTRRLESHIYLVGLLAPRFSLDFMLLRPESGYVTKLRNLAERVAPGRVHFREPVATADIVPTIADYDLGVFILPERILSHKYTLPNKFFDFVAAGLAIAIGPSPEMARLTRIFDMGVVAEDFEPTSLAKVLNALQVEDIERMKRNALEASQRLNAAVEMGKLMAIYRETLAEGGK